MTYTFTKNRRYVLCSSPFSWLEMGCAREDLCLILHDHSKIKWYWDKNAALPSFIHVTCNGCHAVTIFFLRDESWLPQLPGVPLARVSEDSHLWEKLSLSKVTPTLQRQPASRVLGGGECFKGFSQLGTAPESHPSFRAPQSRVGDGTVALLLPLPSELSYPSLTDTDPKDISQYTSCP